MLRHGLTDSLLLTDRRGGDRLGRRRPSAKKKRTVKLDGARSKLAFELEILKNLIEDIHRSAPSPARLSLLAS